MSLLIRSRYRYNARLIALGVEKLNMSYLDKCVSLFAFLRVTFCLFLFGFAWPVMAEFAESGVENKKLTTSLNVVTTFSILADMVQQVGGEYVDVHTLVDWDDDAHVFQPSPDDVKKIAGADLLVLNGLGFEGWLARLLAAANYTGPSIEVTQGVDLIRLTLNTADQNHHDHDHDHDHDIHRGNIYDPHAWHSLKAASVYIENISQALIKIDPLHADYYLSKQATYTDKLNKLDIKITTQLNNVSRDQKRIVVPHNAFAYLARDYDLYIHSLQGVSTESEASAADLAKVVRLIRAMKIRAMFTETTSDKRLIRVVESETEANIKGALVSGALSKELAPTYLDMMEYNSQLIIDALTTN